MLAVISPGGLFALVMLLLSTRFSRRYIDSLGYGWAMSSWYSSAFSLNLSIT